MALAIKEAKKSSEPLKCGVIIIKDGLVIAKAHNTQRADNNAGAHAEMNAIREAGQKLGSKNLNNCEAYCTCEPCIMCLSALSFAKVRKIFFGSSLHKVSSPEKIISIDIDTFLKNASFKPEIVRNFMEKECDNINKD